MSSAMRLMVVSKDNVKFLAFSGAGFYELISMFLLPPPFFGIDFIVIKCSQILL